LLDSIDDGGISDTFVVEHEATFLLRDEFTKAGKVLRTRLVTHVMVGDVNAGESISEFAHMVGSPSESIDDIAKAWAAPDSEGIIVTAASENAFFTTVEDGGPFVDGAIGEGTELEGSSASTVAQELLELEGALGGANDAANLLGVKAELVAGFGPRASRGVGLDDVLARVLHIFVVRERC
jgi:hypothetical protein